MAVAPSTNGLCKLNSQFSEGNKYGRGNPRRSPDKYLANFFKPTHKYLGYIYYSRI